MFINAEKQSVWAILYHAPVTVCRAAIAPARVAVTWPDLVRPQHAVAMPPVMRLHRAEFQAQRPVD